MKITHLFSALLSCMLMFVSCEQTAPKEAPKSEAVKPNLAQIKSDIQAVETNWADAINTKNINAIMALYADDAVSMPNDAPTLTGKAAIQKAQEESFAKNKAGEMMSFTTTEVFSEGNQVLELGTSTTKDAAGKVIGTGKYMALFEKRDGKYVCIREMYNNDQKAK